MEGAWPPLTAAIGSVRGSTETRQVLVCFTLAVTHQPDSHGTERCALLKIVFLCVSTALRAHDWASPVRSLNAGVLVLLSCVPVAMARRLRCTTRQGV